jgi:hypothetical protein
MSKSKNRHQKRKRLSLKEFRKMIERQKNNLSVTSHRFELNEESIIRLLASGEGEIKLKFHTDELQKKRVIPTSLHEMSLEFINGFLDENEFGNDLIQSLADIHETSFFYEFNFDEIYTKEIDVRIQFMKY